MTTELERLVLLLPDLGEGLTEAEVVAWRVAVGSTVEVDQVVAEVETAKAVVEVPVPFAGTVLELHADVGGGMVEVGAPLLSVGRAATPAHTARPEPPAREGDDPLPAAASGHVLVGYGPDHTPAARRRSGRDTAAPSGPAGGAAPAGPVRRDGAGRGRAAPRVISPLVRSLAREHGVDVARLSPSGPHGVVLRGDVEHAIARAGGHAAPAAPDTPLARTPGGAARIPLRGRLRTAADKLSRSRQIPSATAWVDADATDLLRTRDDLRASESGRNVGLLALLARICVAALGRFPELNSAVDEERGEIVRFSDIHLGFAAQTDGGLVVPVIRDAHRMTTAELAAELARLTDLARAGDLRPRAVTGGTFTLNNYGTFGVDGATPLLNAPEAAMLGVGRITDKPWVVDGRLSVRKVTQLSLTFDHRVCDGGTAGGLLRYVSDCVERPATLLADF